MVRIFHHVGLSSDEQWKTWLFRVCRALYYPVTWGLFQKPWKKDPHQTTRIQWNVIPSPKLTARPWKWAIPKGNYVVFQPFIFRCYVSFREGQFFLFVAQMVRAGEVHNRRLLTQPLCRMEWCKARKRGETWRLKEKLMSFFGLATKMGIYTPPNLT